MSPWCAEHLPSEEWRLLPNVGGFRPLFLKHSLRSVLSLHHQGSGDQGVSLWPPGPPGCLPPGVSLRSRPADAADSSCSARAHPSTISAEPVRCTVFTPLFSSELAPRSSSPSPHGDLPPSHRCQRARPPRPPPWSSVPTPPSRLRPLRHSRPLSVPRAPAPPSAGWDSPVLHLPAERRRCCGQEKRTRPSVTLKSREDADVLVHPEVGPVGGRAQLPTRLRGAEVSMPVPPSKPGRCFPASPAQGPPKGDSGTGWPSRPWLCPPSLQCAV